MRVAMLSPFHERCGIASYCEALVEALGAGGAEVTVLSPRRRRRASVLDAWVTVREIQRRRADVAHVQLSLGLYSPRFVFVLARALRAAKIPLVVTLHERHGGGLLRRLRSSRMLAALGGASLVVHNAAHARELAPLRVHVIPHGIAPLRTRDVPGGECARPVIAHFGFIHPDKGIEEVLAAVARLRQGKLPRLRYSVYGAPFETRTARRHFEHLRRLSRELGLGDHVELAGEFLGADELDRALGAADLILLNYRTGNGQASSGAVRQALATGRPVAVSNAPVFDDVRDAVHTLELPLVDEIPRLLEDRELRAGLTRRAQARAETDSWAAVAARHLALFERAQARFRSS